MKNMKKLLADETLISMFREGDNQAFEILLARYADVIMKLIKRSTMYTNDSVDDLYQDVVTLLYEKLRDVYRENGHFAAWVNCVVSHFLCSFYRKKRQSDLPLKLEILHDDTFSDDLLLPVDKREKKFNDLLQLVEILPQDMRELLQMRMWEGMTYQGIADRTGINKSTVVKRLKAIYRQLEKSMLAKGYDDALI